MTRKHWSWAVAFAIATMGWSGAASAQHGDGHHCDPYVSPVLSVADVNADGVADRRDVNEVTQHMGTQDGDPDYHPLYDLNADGQINGRDVAEAARDIGEMVPLVDTQIASATLATMDYYGPGGMYAAMRAGYLPFTSTFAGHGIHLLNFNKIYYDQFDVANVPGLNYDENGNLVAVFYIKTIDRHPSNPLLVDPADDHPPETSFDGLGHHDWHMHMSVWISGLGSTNPANVQFQQNLPVSEVLCRVGQIGGPGYFFPNSSNLYSPKFYMLHLWNHKINTCGRFAGTDPEVAVGYPDEHQASWDPADSWCY